MSPLRCASIRQFIATDFADSTDKDFFLSVSPAICGRLPYSIPVLLTKASFLPSGDQEGTFIVPWPP